MKRDIYFILVTGSIDEKRNCSLILRFKYVSEITIFFSQKEIISKTEETKKSGGLGNKRKICVENRTFRPEIVKNNKY